MLQLQGTKQWDDWANNQHRPTIENGSVTGITLEVSRTAPAQTGQGNGYRETLELNTDYTVTWTQGAGNNLWTYTIQAAAEKLRSFPVCPQRDALDLSGDGNH